MSSRKQSKDNPSLRPAASLSYDEDDDLSWCVTSGSSAMHQAVQTLDDLLTPLPEQALYTAPSRSFLDRWRRGVEHKTMDPPGQHHQGPMNTTTSSGMEHGLDPTDERSGFNPEEGSIELSFAEFERFQEQEQGERAREVNHMEEEEEYSVELEGPLSFDDDDNETSSTSPRKSGSGWTMKCVILAIIGLVVLVLAVTLGVFISRMRSPSSTSTNAPVNNSTGDETPNVTPQRVRARLVFLMDFEDNADAVTMSESQRALFEVATNSFFTDTLAAQTEGSINHVGYQALELDNLSVRVSQQQLQPVSSSRGNRRVQAETNSEQLERRAQQDTGSVMRVDVVVAARTTVKRATLTRALVKLASDNAQRFLLQYLGADLAAREDRDYFAMFESLSVLSLYDYNSDSQGQNTDTQTANGTITDIEKSKESSTGRSSTSAPTGAPLDVVIGNLDLSGEP